MIERIRAHAGRGSGARFEVLWKSGDVTWLPYEQIAKSTALEDYLESQGVQSIRSLPQGSGKPPRDLELIVSAIGWELEKLLEGSGYKAEEDPKTHHRRPRVMDYTNNRHLRRVESRFLLIDPNGNGQKPLNPTHVRDVLAFDRLCREFRHSTAKQPTSYDRIAEVFNADSICPAKLARITTTNAGNVAVMIMGPSPNIDTTVTDSPPQSQPSSSGRSSHRTLKDDQDLVHAARKALDISEKLFRRKGSKTHRRQSFRHAPELNTYSVPGPSSGPRHVSNLEPAIERVPGHAFESEDTVMTSEVEIAAGPEDTTFDPDASAPIDDATVEEPAEYE